MTAEARAFFDRIATRYDRSYALSGAESKTRDRALVELLGAPKRVLDVGVGTGRELSALAGAGHEIVGLELSPQMIALCNRRTRPIPIVLGDAWVELPFADGSFDAIVALHGTLAHPPSEAALDGFYREAARVLRGDLVIVEVPMPSWLSTALSHVRPSDDTAVGRFVDDANGAEITVQLFSLERWRAAARGFVIESQPLGPHEVRLVARRLA